MTATKYSRSAFVLKVALFVFLFFSFNRVYAGSATLSWNANTEPDLSGYKIYYGTSPRTGVCPPGGYPNNINVGKVTTYTFSNLTNGSTYYFSITAYDTSLNESCFSGEVSKVIPASSDTIAPTVPAGLTATAISSSQINLSWTASTDNVGVTGYKIYRGGVQIATTANTSYSDTGLSASTNYSYTVSAYDAAGNNSSQSTPASATTPAAASNPGTVSNLSVVSTNSNSVTLSFTQVNDGAGQPAKYNIRFASPTISWGSAADVSQGTCATPLAGTLIGDALTCTAAGLTTSTQYQFQLIAYRGTLNLGAVFGGLSNIITASTTAALTDTIPPPMPGSPAITVSSTSPTGVNFFISWAVSIDQPSNTAVPVYTYTAGYNDGSSLKSGAVNTNSLVLVMPYHTSNTAQAGYFCVKAVDAAGNVSIDQACNGFTVPAPPVPDTTPPTVPANLTAAAISSSQINLSWVASTDNVAVAGYKLYRAGVQIANTTLTSFSDTGLTPSTSYSYTVLAYDAAGNSSAQSASVSATTQAFIDSSAPTMPTNLSATAVSPSQINLSWTASTDNVGVTGYKIYRGGVQIATTANTSYSNTGLSASTAYAYTVSAYDAAGNVSAQSVQASATTPAATDTTPPADILNLSASNVTQTSAQLNWTAPGNDGNTGTAASYDIRYSASPITSANWTSAAALTGAPTPLIAGSAQSMVVSNLTANTAYYFAVKTADSAGNVSGLSNVLSVTTQSYSLSASLSATPNSGAGSLSNVSLTAAVSGSQTGNINYTFYCNRSDGGTNITTPYDGKYNNQTVAAYTAANLCSYSAPGTYTAKVIVERGLLQAQNTFFINVSSVTTRLAKPPKVTNPKAQKGSVVLSWGNPSYQYLAGITILRRTDTFPQDPIIEAASHTLVNLGSAATQFTDAQVADNVTYYYSIFTKDDIGNYSDPVSIAFYSTTSGSGGGSGGGGSGGGGGGGGGAQTGDAIPPQLPSNTKVSKIGNSVYISWNNPSDSDFKGVFVVRKEGSAPNTRTDGVIVYNNNLQNFTDASADPAKTYYYAVFAYDSNNNYSQPIVLKSEPGKTAVVSALPITSSNNLQLVIPSSISPVFTFTRYLTVGKSGDDVKTLQQILSANPDIYQGPVTGVYGPLTAAAVKKIQTTYGISGAFSPGYGDVGPATRASLNSLIQSRGQSQTRQTVSVTTDKARRIAELKALIAQLEQKLVELLQKLVELKKQGTAQ